MGEAPGGGLPCPGASIVVESPGNMSGSGGAFGDIRGPAGAGGGRDVFEKSVSVLVDESLSVVSARV